MRSRRWFWKTLAVSSIVGLGSLGMGAWVFVDRYLAPLVSNLISQTIERPVYLGRVEAVSLNSIRFGASVIPATATDPDQVQMQAIVANFNLWELLWNRRLGLQVRVQQPQVYLEQDENLAWLNLNIKPSPEEPPIKVEVDRLVIDQAQVVLVARQLDKKLAPAVTVNLPRGVADFFDNNERIVFDLAGQLGGGGDLNIQGQSRPGQTQLELRIQRANAIEVGNLLPLPVRLQGGSLTGDLALVLKPEGFPDITGRLIPQDLQISTPDLPQPLRQVSGQINLRGRVAQLEQVTASLGPITAQAVGSVDFDRGFDLRVTTGAFSPEQVRQLFRLPELGFTLAGQVRSQAQITGPLERPIVNGQITNVQTLQIDRLLLTRLQTNFRLAQQDLQISNLDAQLAEGGLVQARGTLQLNQTQSFSLDLRLVNLPAAPLAQAYGLALPVAGPVVNATVQGRGSLQNLANLQATARALVDLPTGAGLTSDIEVAGGQWQALVQTDNLQLALGDAVPSDVVIAGSLRLGGDTRNLRWIDLVGSLDVAIAGGLIQARDIRVADNSLVARVGTTDLPLGNLAVLPPQLRSAKAQGQFDLAVDLGNLSLGGIEARGVARLDNLANGTVLVEEIFSRNGQWRAIASVRGVAIDQLAPLPNQFQGGILRANVNLAGNFDDLLGIRGVGEASLSLPGGTVNINGLEVANGQWQSVIQATNLGIDPLVALPPALRGSRLTAQLRVGGDLFETPSLVGATGRARLTTPAGEIAVEGIQMAGSDWQAIINPNLNLANFGVPGQLAGRLQATGNLADLSPGGVRLAGEVVFPQGVSAIDRSLQATVTWNGRRLQLQQVRGRDFLAMGYADLDFNRADPLTSFSLDVAAADLNLAALPALPVSLQGRADFQGQIQGTPLTAAGNLQLRNLSAAGVAFAPLLAGPVSLGPGGGGLQLSGGSDRLELALSGQLLPQSFLIQRGQARATGQLRGADNLAVRVENFPLLAVQPLTVGTPLAGRPLGGTLSGNLDLNLADWGAVGSLAIDRPQFNTIRGDRFDVAFDYRRGSLVFSQGIFRGIDSEYQIQGQVDGILTNPSFQARANIVNGNIQDILAALQIFDVEDLTRGLSLPIYGRAADIGRISAGQPVTGLAEQLRRLAELDELLARQREGRQNQFLRLPEIRSVAGRFQGTVTAQAGGDRPLAATFNITGNNWLWGDYRAERVNIVGDFQNQVLSLLPLEFSSGESILRYSGTIGGQSQSGSLNVVNLPVAALAQLITLPPFLGVTGQINAIAQLDGSLANPQARGEINIREAVLNETPVRRVDTSFSYNNSRLGFGTEVSITGRQEEPLAINGSIPIQLPFTGTSPDNNRLNINLQVQNQELAILNLLTRGQVAWEDGEGRLDVTVQGNFDQNLGRPTNLVADGSASFRNGRVRLQILPVPVTAIEGQINFDFDQVRVQNLTGQFSGGAIAIAGNLPIAEPKTDPSPLTVNIGNLAFNLPDVYRGGVQGNVVITGTALAPRIGGAIELADGQVFLTPPPTNQINQASSPTNQSQEGLRPELNNLQLTLGRNTQLTLPPILNFLAAGNLTVNGPFDALRPAGIINIRRGQVNLFATEFRLVGGNENLAQFFPERGLDPFLNLRLITNVQESTSQRINASGSLTEIREQPFSVFGSVQTVRVEARVNGFASELNNRIELTSSPRRTQSEIVALLGGSFVDAFAEGNATLGFASLAGSALLGNLQNQIGDALGLTTFRLFPATLSDRRQASAPLGLGLEVGFDLSPSFSVSALRVLSANQAFQYNLRYRVNENILLRGSTNLSGDNRFLIEYETRY